MKLTVEVVSMTREEWMTIAACLYGAWKGKSKFPPFEKLTPLEQERWLHAAKAAQALFEQPEEGAK